MKRLFLFALITALPISAVVDSAFADDKATDDAVEAVKPDDKNVDVPAIDPEQITRWVLQLDSDVYLERETATQALIDADVQSVDALTQAAQEASPEASVRIAHILEQIYVNSTSNRSIDASEAALENFMALNNPTLASRAELILQANYAVREKRAVAEIERLGGSIKYNNLQNINFNRNIPIESQIQHIVIARGWKGGDEGLKHVKRLTELPTLYYIKGAKISEEALADLQRALPTTRVQIRESAAYLGISGMPTVRGGCQVATVEENSAADEAGLREGDIITHFGETQIADFDALIKVIATREPGDKIEMTIIRFNDLIKLPVVLGEWGASGQP
ncbi:MAG: PDZ domain-containing protein [Planctomycetota bacterium]|nr:PDZ domain-containing protein [Planctomycetota bacterium]MDA1213871.1 PDZ domain-containing protein [Planctomycetota bacterium]